MRLGLPEHATRERPMYGSQFSLMLLSFRLDAFHRDLTRGVVTSVAIKPVEGFG